MKPKTILITGAANGIGKCLTEEFSKEKHNLILWDKDALGLKNLQAYLTNTYRNEVQIQSFDLTDILARKIAINNIGFDNQKIDILINNAGIGLNKVLTETTIYDLLWEINYKIPVDITLSLLPHINECGTIVNVSSGQAFFKLPTWGAYSATKAAFGTWSETLNIELSSKGINVLTVYPFMVNTGFYAGMEEVAEGWGSKISMKLLPYYSQKPEKVAKIIFRAIKKGKRIEMVHPINWVGYYLDTIPSVGYIVRKVANYILTKKD